MWFKSLAKLNFFEIIKLISYKNFLIIILDYILDNFIKRMKYSF